MKSKDIYKILDILLDENEVAVKSWIVKNHHVVKDLPIGLGDDTINLTQGEINKAKERWTIK